MSDHAPDATPAARPKGMRCPVPGCGGFFLVVGRHYPRPGERVRYLRCDRCGHRGRSRERLDPPTVPKAA